jgi:hypothetical protein
VNADPDTDSLLNVTVPVPVLVIMIEMLAAAPTLKLPNLAMEGPKASVPFGTAAFADLGFITQASKAAVRRVTQIVPRPAKTARFNKDDTDR